MAAPSSGWLRPSHMAARFARSPRPRLAASEAGSSADRSKLVESTLPAGAAGTRGRRRTRTSGMADPKGHADKGLTRHAHWALLGLNSPELDSVEQSLSMTPPGEPGHHAMV